MTEPYDRDNIFARILRGEIPCHRIYEDDTLLAMMDLFPQSPGHLLVLPKAPSRNLLDADPATLAGLLPAVQKFAVAVRKALLADGVRVAQFNEAPAGQTVFHLHVHVIPIYEGERLKPHAAGGRADDAELAAQAGAIAAALG
jgi:histidine triad (HIT) family protein